MGVCEGLPDKSAALTAAIEGRVVGLPVLPGTMVKAGDPIVELDSSVAAATVGEKTRERDALQAALVLLRALPRPEEQKNYKLAIDTAVVAVEKAKAIVQRLQPLRERGEISPQQMFEAELALRQARLQQETAETQFQVAMLGARREAIDEAQARVSSASSAVQTAQAQLKLCTIRAPIDGRLDGIHCQLGQTLPVGAAVGKVVDLTTVYAQIWLPVPEARLVEVGQAATIEFSGTRTDGTEALASEERLSGRVVFVGRAIDSQTGNLPVRILIEKAAGRIALGETLTASITVAEKTGVLAVPVEAVEQRGETALVRVVRDGKAVQLQPRLGMRDRRWIEVAGTDLAEGEPVIVDGGYNLPEDAEVTVAEKEEKEAAGVPAEGKSP